jgi:hypothetical protein
LKRSIVPLAERKAFLQKLRERRAYYSAAHCRFWVFEESDLAGAFIEFIEAEDSDTLARALAGAPNHVVDPARIYHEVELD